MAVLIRMKRMGRRHRPFFRVCVMDARSPRDGKAIEEVGHYDPMVRDKSARVQLKLDRIDYWMSVGAQPSENVAALIKKVRTNRFGTGSEPAPLTPPKALPEPEPEAAATDETPAATEEAADGTETAVATEEAGEAKTTES